MGVIVGSVIALIVVGGIAYGVVIYNRLVALKHNVGQAWSNIDVLLKQRHDELPKLVDTARQYMGYEQETLKQVIEARNQVETARQHGEPKEVGEAESRLRGGLGSFFALAEDYPDLKADQSFQQLQSRISELEESIADRREFYNAAVNSNNIRLEQFPDVLVARMGAFRAFDLLEFEAEETADHDIGALFGSTAG